MTTSGDLEPTISVHLDRLLADRGMTLIEPSQLVGVSTVNLSIRKNGRTKARVLADRRGLNVLRCTATGTSAFPLSEPAMIPPLDCAQLGAVAAVKCGKVRTLTLSDHLNGNGTGTRGPKRHHEKQPVTTRTAHGRYHIATTRPDFDDFNLDFESSGRVGKHKTPGQRPGVPILRVRTKGFEPLTF